MSYNITYGRDKKRYPSIVNPWKKPVICVAVALTVIIAAHVTGISAAIWRFLLPGDPAVTEAALLGMIENITGGASISDAVSAFCQEIVHAAKPS